MKSNININAYLANDFIDSLKKNISSDSWITLASFHEKHEYPETIYWPLLIPSTEINKSLETDSRELKAIERHFWTSTADDKAIDCSNIKIEHLVDCHYDDDIIYDISDDFNSTLNLSDDGKGSLFVSDESNTRTDVVKYEAHEIQVNVGYLRKFLSIKKMALILYFEHAGFYGEISQKEIAPYVPLKEKGEDFRFERINAPWLVGPWASAVIVRGQKIISPIA